MQKISKIGPANPEISSGQMDGRTNRQDCIHRTLTFHVGPKNFRPIFFCNSLWKIHRKINKNYAINFDHNHSTTNSFPDNGGEHFLTIGLMGGLATKRVVRAKKLMKPFLELDDQY